MTVICLFQFTFSNFFGTILPGSSSKNKATTGAKMIKFVVGHIRKNWQGISIAFVAGLLVGLLSM
jgi:hypothetical protein